MAPLRLEARPMQDNPASFDVSRLKGLGVRPLASLLKHRRAAWIALALVLVAGIPYAWTKGVPHYMATATLEVAPRYMRNVKEDNELDLQSNQQYREFVTQQMRSLTRYDIVQDALASLGPQKTLWYVEHETERHAIERLQAALVVIPVTDTYMVQVMLESPRRKGVDVVVNAVVEAALKRLRAEQVFGADDRVLRLTRREAEVVKAINLATDRRTQISLALGITSFAEAAGSPYDKILADTRNAAAEARNIRLQAEAHLEAFLARGETDTTTRSVAENVLGDPGLNSLKSGLNNRRTVLLTTLSGLTPQHPAAVAARSELAEIDAEIAQQSQRLSTTVRGDLRTRYEMTADQARRYEEGMQRVVKEQEAASENFARLFNEAVTLSNELAQNRKELETLRDRLNFFAAERGSIGFVRGVTPALPPEYPFGPGRKKLLMMVIAAALAAALVVPVGIDLTDRRIRSVTDAEKILAIPAMGWLVERSNTATQALGSDQLRRLAAALLRERGQTGGGVFGLCSVKPGAGATTLTLELAQTLSELGYPTLAVEANAFKPATAFGRDSAAGLAQVLAGEVAPMTAIQSPRAALPARVCVGTTSAQPHLGKLAGFGDALQTWAGEYAFVLVDMPPLLLSADAELLLQSVDRTLLVVEANAISPGELLRAARILDAARAGAVGMVVSRIEPLERGGYLRSLMIEQLSGRKFSEFQTLPGWRLALLTHLPLRVDRWWTAVQAIGRRLPWRRRRLVTPPDSYQTLSPQPTRES